MYCVVRRKSFGAGSVRYLAPARSRVVYDPQGRGLRFELLRDVTNGMHTYAAGQAGRVRKVRRGRIEAEMDGYQIHRLRGWWGRVTGADLDSLSPVFARFDAADVSLLLN